MELRIFTDGGSLNNPGEAACAFVIYKDDTLLVEHGERLGIATNNDAEYTGLIKALEKVKELLTNKTVMTPEKISVFSDSLLMVSQLNGLYKIKHEPIRQYVFKIRVLENDLKIPITFTHVLREKNELADSLVKKALGR
jgi:ribonuclease HI